MLNLRVDMDLVSIEMWNLWFRARVTSVLEDMHFLSLGIYIYCPKIYRTSSLEMCAGY